MSAKAVYVASPYSDTFIDLAKILAMVVNKQTWRESLSVNVCTQSGPIMKISPLGKQNEISLGSATIPFSL